MSLSNLLIKLIFVSIIAYITGFLIHHSDSSLLFTLILLLSIPFVCFIIQQPFDYILKCMLFVLFFMPIHYVKFLNIFNIINPLTILATVLCFKILHEKFVQHKKSFNLTSIDYFYFFCSYIYIISNKYFWIFKLDFLLYYYRLCCLQGHNKSKSGFYY